MRRAKWILVALLHVGAALAAFIINDAVGNGGRQELPFVVAAMLGANAAAWFYHRHDRLASPMGFRLLVGVELAALTAIVGIAVHLDRAA